MTGAPPSPPSAAATEAELRRLLAQITGSSQDLVSEILAFGSHPIHYIHTESLDRWIDKISRWRRAPACPESVARAKQLLFRVLDERVVRHKGGVASSRVWSVPIVDMVAGLRECAAGPEAEVGGGQEWKEHVLRARKVLCRGKEEVPQLDRFTSRLLLPSNNCSLHFACNVSEYNAEHVGTCVRLMLTEAGKTSMGSASTAVY